MPAYDKWNEIYTREANYKDVKQIATSIKRALQRRKLLLFNARKL